MLLNTFFDILKITQKQREGESAAQSSSFTVQIRLNPEHKIFEGHFPGNPVVPGVCQLRMVSEIVSEIAGKEMRLLEADNIKFLSMIDPHAHRELRVDCSLKESEDGNLHVTASITDQEQLFFKYKSVFI